MIHSKEKEVEGLKREKIRPRKKRVKAQSANVCQRQCEKKREEAQSACEKIEKKRDM